MAYDWKIELNSIDISDKVSRFSITAGLRSFCRELVLDIADPETYSNIDFSRISESPEIEVFTKTGTEFVSQGKFFVERPAITSTLRSALMQGVWGRSTTALLAEPFAPKITKAWETQTTFFAICEELCALVGLDFDSAYSEIDDFVIFPYTYEADGLYPADIITELAALAGAIATTDAAGHVCIKQVDYSPAAADVTLSDAQISEISESPEWPVFANRVRITPTGNLASYAIDLFIPNQCLHADAISKTKMFAQVRDPEGEPINGIVVDWSHDSITANLAYAKSNTQEILIQNERTQATGYRSFNTSIPASLIDGVWALTDPGKITNLAAGGYTIDGETVTLTTKLAYCDQSLVVSYRAAGMAVNWLTAGPAADDVTVTADVEGQRTSKIVYIENPCQCPPTIKLTAAPSSVIKNEAASLLVYVEESGPVAGRVVFMAETSESKKGSLGWTTARVGQVNVKNEKTYSRNEIAGLTQCEISMYPATVAQVRRIDPDTQEPFGANLHASHKPGSKVVTLNTNLPTGVELAVSYVAQGAALNTFTGQLLGAARLVAHIKTTSEESKEDTATVNVTDKSTIDGYPSYESGGIYGGVGGFDDDFEPDNGSFCVKTDGTKVKCPKGQRCCSDGYTVDCREPGDCVGGDIDPCVPASIQGRPDPQTLGMRFATGLQYNCTCEEMCMNEFDIYGTTAGYDGASGKKVSDLALEQCDGCEEGSPAYWEKYAELKQAALNDCLAACEETDFRWDEENTPETMTNNSSVSVYVIGGTGPFTFSTGNNGYFFDSELTAKTIVSEFRRSVTLYSSGGECGVDIDGSVTVTVMDSKSAMTSGSLRNTTAGKWVVKEEISAKGTSFVCPKGACVTGVPILLYRNATQRWRTTGTKSECIYYLGPNVTWNKNNTTHPADNPLPYSYAELIKLYTGSCSCPKGSGNCGINWPIYYEEWECQ